MENQLNQPSQREGKLIGYSSLILCILLIIHNFIALDTLTAKTLLSQAGQKASDSAVANILNSFRYTGIMYILAYLAVSLHYGIDINICGGLCLQSMFQMYYLH